MHENQLQNQIQIPEENIDALLLRLQERVVALELENNELKRASKSANELVSIATHQLRSPLTSMRGYTSCVLEGDYGEVPAKMKEPLNIILRSTETLGKTVNDFLDVSKIEQGEMRYNLKDFSLVDLAKEVAEEMRLGISQDGIELRINIPDGNFKVHSDKSKLKHVLINLIDNAHKYVKSGWIEVSLEEKPDNKILFSVKDSGIGIEPENIPNLFKKFSREADASKLNSRGSGLGLYIARKIVEARHGRIWAESKGKGEGTQFYVELDGIKE
ncbi:MAG: HAMP domain-containing sensor histidine kinase [Patescibacteria group bacterium]